MSLLKPSDDFSVSIKPFFSAPVKTDNRQLVRNGRVVGEPTLCSFWNIVGIII